MQRLSGLDAAFLYFETPRTHLHVCGILILDTSTVPGGYSWSKMRAFIEERLGLQPQFRQRLMEVPLHLAPPVTIEDPDFDLDYHVRRIACPSPGGPEELADIAGEIASRPLDRRKPLWELWVIEGLADGHVGVVAKMHHATTDGVSGANLMVHLFDLTPEGTPGREEMLPPAPPSKPAPSDLRLLGDAVVELFKRPVQLAKVLPATVGGVVRVVQDVRRRNGPGMAMPLTAPRTPFNGAITAHRKIAYQNVAFDDVKTVKQAFGTTINDVVLAVCAGALRRYLEQRGELPDKALSAMVPVSVRDDNDDRPGSNKISGMFCTLATDIDDPVERLQHISAANRGAKEQHHAVGATLLQDWAQFPAPTTFALAAKFYSGLRLADRHPPIYNVIISNVPGPPIPLYFAGARLAGLYPLGPTFDGSGLNITVLSNMDQIGFGFIACRELVPDLWDLAHDVEPALQELVKAAELAS